MIKNAKFRILRRRVPKFDIVTPPEITPDAGTNRKITAKIIFRTIRKSIRSIKGPERLLTGIVTTAISIGNLEKTSGVPGEQKVSAIRLFRHLYSVYGLDWIDFDPLSFHRDKELGEYVEQILALKNILRRNEFFSNPYVFEKLALALSDEEIMQNVPQGLSPEVMAYAIAVGNILRPDKEYSEEIEAFVVAHLLNNGFSVLLYPFDMEGPYIPSEVLEITKKVHDHLFGTTDKIDDVIDIQANKYVSLLSELANMVLDDLGREDEEDVDKI